MNTIWMHARESTAKLGESNNWNHLLYLYFRLPYVQDYYHFFPVQKFKFDTWVWTLYNILRLKLGGEC